MVFPRDSEDPFTGLSTDSRLVIRSHHLQMVVDGASREQPRHEGRDRCAGSRALPVSATVERAGDGDESGLCPVCGKRLPLGYALLLPTHSSVAAEPVR
jgi:hypothetical protein